MLFLLADLTSCRSDNLGIEGCFSALVTGAREDADTIKAYILEAPEGLSDTQPHKGYYVVLLKSDLQDPNIQINDTIDFIIVHYEIKPLPKNGPSLWRSGYFCKVKPCK